MLGARVGSSRRTALYRSGYIFRGNRFLARRNAFEFRRVHNIDVSSNTVSSRPTTGCGTARGRPVGGLPHRQHHSNGFSGANNVFMTDALSTGITSTGNTTG